MANHNLLKLLDRPIAFHRCFVSVGGSITSAVFLSQAFYWQGRTTLEGGWFFKTREDWEEETGLSRKEQETARKHLRDAGVLEEKLVGIPAQLHYRINTTKLEESLMKPGLPTSWPDSGQQAGPKVTNKLAPFGPTIRTETTSEITTETTMETRSVEEMALILLRWYHRNPTDRLDYMEEHALAGLLRRPEFLKEMEELETFRALEIAQSRAKYLPQSIAVLLRDWSKHLDRARSRRNEKQDFDPPPGG